tara:strand:+ start:1897 stop:2070 length:174 start_codon:yes stop_codon:yes gene_type:complete
MSLAGAFIYANGNMRYPTYEKQTKFQYFWDLLFYFIALISILFAGLGISIDIINPCM